MCLKCKQSHHTLLHFENSFQSSSDRDLLVSDSANACSLNATGKVYQPAVSLDSENSPIQLVKMRETVEIFHVVLILAQMRRCRSIQQSNR